MVFVAEFFCCYVGWCLRCWFVWVWLLGCGNCCYCWFRFASLVCVVLLVCGVAGGLGLGGCFSELIVWRVGLVL